MADHARLTLLDGFGLEFGDEVLEVPKTLQRLLALLSLRGQATRTQAVGLMWPESDEQKAFGRLRTALWRLHQLGAPVIVTRGESLSLHDWVGVDVDELVLTAQLGTPTLRRGGLRELLPGWYDDWVLVERERLRQLYLHTVEKLAAQDLKRGNYAGALDAALAALRAEPLRESPHRLLLEIHLAEGNYSEAIGTYDAYHRLLRRELGVNPSPNMRRLLDEALRPDVAATA